MGIPMAAFLLLPLIALAVHGRGSFLSALGEPEAHEAILVSLRTSLVSLATIVLLGTPLAVALGRGRGLGRTFLGALVEAPLVLPPAAAGIGLLLALGRRGLVPTSLPFSVGAVVLAQSFVAAPFFIRALAAAVHDIEPDVEEAAAIDGASTAAVLRKVTMPLVAGSFVSGAVMAWARSVGEFGATILFAGNLPGRTQTMPLWIYVGFETNLDQAVGLSVVLLVLALAVLIVVRMIERIGLDGPFQNT